MLKTRLLATFALMFVVMHVLSPAVRADDAIDQKAIGRAHTFLKGAKRGREILGYVHFGTKYVRHKYAETRFVTDGDGKKVPGHFALIYTFDWNADGTSDVAFLCDRRGNVYEVQVIDHNAVINQPFGVANATIQILGNLIIEAFKDQMTADEKRQIQKAVDGADAKSLLEMSLKLQQTFGK